MLTAFLIVAIATREAFGLLPLTKKMKAQINTTCGVPIEGPRDGELLSHSKFGRCVLPANFSCQWDLAVKVPDPDARFLFTFAEYEMPLQEQPCSDSYLRFYDGHDTSRPLPSATRTRPPAGTDSRATRRSSGVTEFLTATTTPTKRIVPSRRAERMRYPASTISAASTPKKKCDGSFDCNDRSDEKDCKVSICAAGESRCRHRFSCYKTSKRCDGISDCRDDSDEENCKQKCNGTDLMCDDKQRCYTARQHCNGHSDCIDGSDEKDCTVAICHADETPCRHRFSCYKTSKWCDGISDCNDNSDEENCQPAVCKLDEFLCRDARSCFKKGQRCDGTEQCSDGSDESGCSP